MLLLLLLKTPSLWTLCLFYVSYIDNIYISISNHFHPPTKKQPPTSGEDWWYRGGYGNANAIATYRSGGRSHAQMMRVWYCWWLKSGDHQLRLVVSPILPLFSAGFGTIPGGCLGFFPSTESFPWNWASKRQISSSNHWCFQGLYSRWKLTWQWKSTIWRCIAYWKWRCSSVMLVFRCFRLKLLVLPGSVGVSLKGFLDSMGVSWMIFVQSISRKNFENCT